MQKRTSPSSRPGNNFGVLRLLFAGLVVFAHVPEAMDGHRGRELLTRLFGTLSFGDLAVDAFFLISGYLISLSWLRSQSASDYLRKRLLRIFPGFIAAYLFTVLIVAPLGGGDLASTLVPGQLAEHLARIVLLHGPFVRGSFQGLPIPSLNVSVWTIPYEFNCYLMVMALGWAGLFKRRVLVLSLSLLLLTLGTTPFKLGVELPFPKVLGTFSDNARLMGMFCTGATYQLYQDRVVLHGRGALFAAVALFGWMHDPRFCEPALAILGGYLIFWFAFEVKSERLGRIGSDTDISYGLYLYAWPVQNLLIYHYPGASPWLTIPTTLAIAALLGYLSWTFIERPASCWTPVRSPAAYIQPA